MSEDRIAALSCWNGELRIEPISGGITNRNYLVHDSGRQFVARICEDRRFLGIDRRNELQCQSAAHRAGVSPEVVHAEDNILVSRFINGPTFEGREQDETLIDRIAASLKQLHRCREELAGEMLFFCPFQTVRTYAATAREISAALPGDIDEAIDRCNRLSGEMNGYRPTLCHNDLLPANVLDDGRRLWLIDWEYAGIGNPLFDLASVSANCRYDDARDARLVQSYAGSADPEVLRQMKILKLVSLLREALWAVIQTVKSDFDFDYAGYAARHFDAFRACRSS